MRQPLWKLVVLSALLSVVLGVVQARPAMATLYYCVSGTLCGDPETTEVLYSEMISCPYGKHPICVRHYDSNCCVVSVTAEGCSTNPPPYATCP